MAQDIKDLCAMLVEDYGLVKGEVRHERPDGTITLVCDGAYDSCKLYSTDGMSIIVLPDPERRDDGHSMLIGVFGSTDTVSLYMERWSLPANMDITRQAIHSFQKITRIEGMRSRPYFSMSFQKAYQFINCTFPDVVDMPAPLDVGVSSSTIDDALNDTQSDIHGRK